MDAPIRLSGPTLKVLNDLLRHERNGRSGADITRATKVPPGTIYPLLTRLKARRVDCSSLGGGRSFDNETT